MQRPASGTGSSSRRAQPASPRSFCAHQHGTAWRPLRVTSPNVSSYLVKRPIDGAWDAADYLVIQPGERLAMSNGEDVIQAEPVPAG